MTTKLTLTVEDGVIKTAKVYARQNGRSLSELVENYLKTLSTKDRQKHDLSPRVKRMIGAVKLPRNFDYKAALNAAIEQKHRK